ncbi:MAG: glycosyltransferase family 4 protein [Smithella sp.]
MNICFVIYGHLNQVSGGYLYDRMIANRLRSMGEKVEIISLPARNYLFSIMDNISATKLSDTIAKNKTDLLLQDELCHPSLFYLNQRLRKKWECPVISVVHHLRSSEIHPEWRIKFYRDAEKRYLKTIDGFIFNSKTTRAVLENFLGEDRLSVVAYPGGDHVNPAITNAHISERSRSFGRLKILFIGNVIPRKGLHTLVAALRRLPRHLWQLTVVGSLSMAARYAQRITRLIQDNGLKDQIHMTDSIDNEELANLLEGHHCLAVPSFYEGFGIVYLEAMAYGLPVIATKAGAVSEIIDDGTEGFLVPPGDERALAECIDRFIYDRNLLARMSFAAQRRYKKHPSWADSTGRIHNFLHKMALIK